MTALKVGGLFFGYGGLDLAVAEVFGAELAWLSDICRIPTKDNPSTHHEQHRGPCRIAAHRYPGVPNLGDVTAVDWSQVEPVDIITGGSPCQDLSHAGKRAGMTDGTRSNLWVAMREAIAQLRPGVVVWENVRGAYSAAADSDLEQCEGCLGDGSDGPSLRALGRVLGDLSDLGYDCRWHGLRAADVGAPHGRFRVFVIATDASSNARRFGDGDGQAPAVAADLGHERGRSSRSGRTRSADGGLLPTPRATDGTKGGPNQRGSSGDLMLPSAVAMLPTPQARDWKGAGPADAERHDPNLSAITHLLLPTPTSADAKASGSAGYGGNEFCTLTDVTARGRGGMLLPTPMVGSSSPAAHGQISGQYRDAMTEAMTRWGDYAPAIALWESLTRPAPEPTMTSTKGNPQLSPRFVEWLMGLPEGWVTDVPGITRNEALKALGNGVVPQQAVAALRLMVAT